MENREILVANTKTQRRYKVMTDATTLGELKTALDNQGIDYDGMDFTEGITKVQLLGDDTQLPQNVQWKGNTTNNLVILLTNTKKKIESGEGSRKKAYEKVKELELQNAIKEEFGRNFTQVSTDDLWKFISIHDDATNEKEEDILDDLDDEEEEVDYPECNGPVEDVPSALTIANAAYDLIKLLVKTKAISIYELEAIKEQVCELVDRMKEAEGLTVKVGDAEITDDDIDAMLANL